MGGSFPEVVVRAVCGIACVNVRSMAQALIWSGSASVPLYPWKRRFGTNRRFHQSVIGDDRIEERRSFRLYTAR